MFFLKLKRLQQPPLPSDFDGLPYPRDSGKVVPQFFFMKMNANDVKEITYNMPLVTFFSVLERPGNRKGNNPPWLDEG